MLAFHDKKFLEMDAARHTVHFCMKHLYLLLAIIGLCVVTTQAAPPKEETSKAGAAKGKAKTGRMPFYGEVVAVTSRTLTLKGGEGKEDRKFTISAATKIHNDEKPATSDDIKVGKKVGGSAEKNADGSLKALTINVGAAQGNKPKAKTEKGDAAKGKAKSKSS
jgi:hypothetical protein